MKRYWSPDGGSGTSGDGGTPTDSADSQPKTVTIDKAAVSAVATEFARELSSKMVAPPAAPAPPAGPSLADKAAEQAALKAAAAEIMTHYDELCAKDKFGEAAQYLMAEQAKLNQRVAGAQDPTTDPAFKGLFKSMKREAARTNPELFEKYGPEIEAEVAKSAPGARLDPDTWDAAARVVSAVHLDEVIEMRTKAREKADEARHTPVQAPGSRGRSTTTDVALDDDDLMAAKVMGFDPATYKEVKKRAEAATIKGGFSDGMYRLTDDKPPAPGRF